DVDRAEDIGLDAFVPILLEHGHVLERRGVKHNIGLELRDQAHDALPVANIGNAPDDFRLALFPPKRLQNRMQRGLRMLNHQQTASTKSDDSITDFGADRAATTRHDNSLAGHQLLKPAVINLDARSQQKILDSYRCQLDGRTTGIERRQLAHAQAKLARTHKYRFRTRFGRERRWRKNQPRHPIATAL